MEKLAIEGGKPVRTKGPLFERDMIGEEEINAVVKVLKDVKLRRAEVAEEYEAALAKWFGVKYALAVSSGTAALNVAVAAMGVGPGMEGIVTPYTFIASDSCLLQNNAIPIFADIDPDYLTMDPDDVKNKITDQTKVIIPVSITGTPYDMDPLMELAEEHDLWMLEDAAQSPGATYKGKLVGTMGDIGMGSTIAGKFITTGEGGYALTNNEELYEKMWGYQNFARKKGMGWASNKHWGLPCTHYRITNIQAAIGLEQLKKLKGFVKKRNEYARYLNENLKDVEGIETPKEPPWGEKAYYWYTVRLRRDVLGVTRDQFAQALGAEGIYDYEHYKGTTRFLIPQHLEPLFVNKTGYGGTKCPFECPWYKYREKLEYKEGQCPVAEKACEEVMWVMNLSPSFTKEDLDDVIEAIRKVAGVYAERQKKKIKVKQ